MQHDYTECRFCSILCRKQAIIESKHDEFLFCNFGIACTCGVGVRATGLTTGQVQDNYILTMGQLQDKLNKYKTTTGQLQGNFGPNRFVLVLV